MDESPPTPPSRLSVAVSAVVVVVLAIATSFAFLSGSGGSHDTGSATGPNDTTATVDGATPGLSASKGAAAVGDKLPSLSFEDLDGGQVSLEEFAGQPLVINFFASYCTPCVTEMPDFESVHAAIGDQVTFMGIDVGEQADAGRRIVDQTGVTYRIGYDPTGRIMRDLGGVAMPTTVLVTADGTIAQIHSGQLSADKLRAAIDEKLLS